MDKTDQTLFEEMLDKQQLHELACRYFQAVDRKQFEKLAGLYHPDALHDHGAMFTGNREDLVAWLEQSLEPLTTQHFLGNYLFAIEGDRARGELYTINYHILPDKNGDRDYIAGGRYLDEYIKENNQWSIWRRQRVIDWSHDRKSSPASLAAQLHTNETEAF